jgi:hypothetical protein
VAPYGSCIVVPGDEFDPDWEVFLGDQGYKCFFIDLDRKPVTLVKLPKGVGKSEDEKEVYRPPSQVLPKHWSPEEDEVLIKLWNDNVLIEKMTPSFPHRTEAAIRLRIQRLEKYGKIKKRTGRPKAPMPRSSVKRWSKDEEQLLVEFWNKDLKVPDMLAHFPGRTRHSIAMHIDVLQKAGKISPRWKAGEGKRKPEMVARAGSEPAISPTPERTPMHTPASTLVPVINTTLTIQLSVNCNDRNAVANLFDIIEKMGLRKKEASS